MQQVDRISPEAANRAWRNEPRVTPTRRLIDNRNPDLSFLVDTAGKPWFRLRVATEAALLADSDTARRTSRNFYDSGLVPASPLDRQSHCLVPRAALHALMPARTLHYSAIAMDDAAGAGAVEARRGQGADQGVSVDAGFRAAGLTMMLGLPIERMQQLRHGEAQNAEAWSPALDADAYQETTNDEAELGEAAAADGADDEETQYRAEARGLADPDDEPGEDDSRAASYEEMAAADGEPGEDDAVPFDALAMADDGGEPGEDHAEALAGEGEDWEGEAVATAGLEADEEEHDVGGTAAGYADGFEDDADPDAAAYGAEEEEVGEDRAVGYADAGREDETGEDATAAAYADTANEYEPGEDVAAAAYALEDEPGEDTAAAYGDEADLEETPAVAAAANGYDDGFGLADSMPEPLPDEEAEAPRQAGDAPDDDAVEFAESYADAAPPPPAVAAMPMAPFDVAPRKAILALIMPFESGTEGFARISPDGEFEGAYGQTHPAYKRFHLGLTFGAFPFVQENGTLRLLVEAMARAMAPTSPASSAVRGGACAADDTAGVGRACRPCT